MRRRRFLKDNGPLASACAALRCSNYNSAGEALSARASRPVELQLPACPGGSTLHMRRELGATTSPIAPRELGVGSAHA